MITRRAHFVVLIVAALLFGAAQCVASCAAQGCPSPAPPPCHQHSSPQQHHVAAGCTFEFLLPDSPVAAPDISAAGVAVMSVDFVVIGDSATAAPLAPADSPPPRCSVLRI